MVDEKNKAKEQKLPEKKGDHEWEEYACEDKIQVFTREEKGAEAGEGAGISSIICRVTFETTDML